MIRIAIALVIGGAVLAFFGYNESKLASAADTEPQTITAADLIANGPGDNAHVRVTDLYILDSYAYEGPDDGSDTYDKLWVPAIAMDDPWAVDIETKVEEAIAANPENPDFTAIDQIPYPTDLGLVIYTKDVGNAVAFDGFYQETELQGLIINEIENLKGDELSNLKQGYPSLDASKVLILEHNRKPKSGGTTMLMMVGGVLLILAGPALFFFTRSKA